MSHIVGSYFLPRPEGFRGAHVPNPTSDSLASTSVHLRVAVSRPVDMEGNLMGMESEELPVAHFWRTPNKNSNRVTEVP